MNGTSRMLGVMALLLAVCLWVTILVTYDHSLSEEIKEFPIEKVPEKVSQGVDGEIKEKHGGRKGAIRPPKKLNVSGPHIYLMRNRSSAMRLAPISLYNAVENTIAESSVIWSEFVTLPKETIRSKSEKMDANVNNTLRLCPTEIVDKLSAKLNGKDLEFCHWALSDTGGKVKLGESYGTLTTAEQGKFESLGCGNIVKAGESFSCDDERGDSLIQNWRRNPVKGLCEDKAESKINCYDTPNGRTRYCMFENAMMSCKRMRKKVTPLICIYLSSHTSSLHYIHSF